MAFLLDIPDLRLDQRPQEVEARFRVYRQYLEENESRLPPKAFAFAIADWHYAPNSHQSPHDSWVEHLTIREIATRARSEERTIAISVRLKGAYHDGYIELNYEKVRSYSLTTPAEFEFPPTDKVGHGDWLIDEVRVSERGLVVHEVRFSRGSRWLIECTDLEYKWISDVASHSGG